MAEALKKKKQQQPETRKIVIYTKISKFLIGLASHQRRM